MDALTIPILCLFACIMLVFCVYGLHRSWLVWSFRRTGGLQGETPGAPPEESDLPSITVQLPMYNERHVAERVIEAACAIDYPRDRFLVQVLDDSTDDSADVARNCCERLAAAGAPVRYIHRTNRSGFKAGALAAGLDESDSELVAIFDADFVPPPDVLRRVVGDFSDERLGMVQMRWGHLNRDDSLITRLQAICIDGHFVIEQTVRSRLGLWFNFNGTAGVWRRRAIDEAGGWQADTLTEDTDLSYRAQLAGWRFRFRTDVVCPAELPPTIGAMMCQQHRWNKGLLQTALKLYPQVLRSSAPLRTKLEAWFHLTSPIPFVAMFLLSILAILAIFSLVPAPAELGELGTWASIALGSGCVVLGTLGAATFYTASQTAQDRGALGTIRVLPALMAVGIGMSLLNTRAIIEALIGHKSPFVRTPKFAGQRVATSDQGAGRRVIPAGVAEVLLGILMCISLVVAFTTASHPVGVPFLILFAWGYLYTGVGRLADAARIAPSPS